MMLKGINEKVLGILLAVVVLAVLLYIALGILGGAKESGNPLLNTVKNLTDSLKCFYKLPC